VTEKCSKTSSDNAQFQVAEVCILVDEIVLDIYLIHHNAISKGDNFTLQTNSLHSIWHTHYPITEIQYVTCGVFCLRTFTVRYEMHALYELKVGHYHYDHYSTRIVLVW
jgi:hypothetical protein